MTALHETLNKNGSANLAGLLASPASTAVQFQGFSPIVTRERFAEMVGLPLGVVIGWCNKGLVPCVSIGKYSLINVALLANRCVAKEFS